MPVAYDEFSMVQDELNGIRVRSEFYSIQFIEDATWVDFVKSQVFDDGDGISAPFAVVFYDEGLDYDEDGNSYFDDWPKWVGHSYFASRESAERELAEMEEKNPNTSWDIQENYWIEPWNIKHKVIHP